jgi:hypothetical protein
VAVLHYTLVVSVLDLISLVIPGAPEVPAWVTPAWYVLLLVAVGLALVSVAAWLLRHVRIPTRLHVDELVFLVALGTLTVGLTIRGLGLLGTAGAPWIRQAALWAPLIYVLLWLRARWGRHMACQLGLTAARDRFWLLFVGWLALPGWAALVVLLLRMTVSPWFLASASPGTDRYWRELGWLWLLLLLIVPSQIVHWRYRRRFERDLQARRRRWRRR